MPQTDSFHCFYVDHSFFDARQIGSIYNQLTGLCPGRRNKECLVLSTCQRIEAYSCQDNNPLSALDIPFQRGTGRDAVKKRLLSICCGIESQILGERNIYYQVENACAASHPDSTMRNLFAETLAEARRIRDDNDFHAEMDYEDVSINILRENTPGDTREKPALLVIGSGMLARNFLKKNITEHYDDLLFITRAPKNLKKKLDQPLKEKVLRAGEFLALPPMPFQCIIATNGLEKDGYADEIRTIVTSPQCRGVFDLSAVPLFQTELKRIFYADTYSSIYFSYVNRYNARKMPAADEIRSIIARRFC